MLVTPFLGVASVPAAAAIFCTSSLASRWARAKAPAPKASTIAMPPAKPLLILGFIVDFPFWLRGLPNSQLFRSSNGSATGRVPHATLTVFNLHARLPRRLSLICAGRGEL